MHQTLHGRTACTTHAVIQNLGHGVARHIDSAPQEHQEACKQQGFIVEVEQIVHNDRRSDHQPEWNQALRLIESRLQFLVHGHIRKEGRWVGARAGVRGDEDKMSGIITQLRHRQFLKIYSDVWAARAQNAGWGHSRYPKGQRREGGGGE